MADYKAPLRDIDFVMNKLLGFPAHYAALPGNEELSQEVVSAVLEESAKFSENVLAPMYRVGDIEGCQWDDGNVSTPTGFKEAYQQYVKAGWPSMTHSSEFGGQDLPNSLGIVTCELIGTGNFAWGAYPVLSTGAMNTIKAHGTDEQKSAFLPNLVSGNWTGTMCLTEPHCGTDLGLLRTKAAPNSDGSYSVSGTKIFITGGDHDMADNIVHIVLARIEGAPAGTKGISLFVVPKFNVDAEGNIIDRNAVNCGSIEHKMGIHGSSTCVMNFDSAKGFLIGQENKGLSAMFTFMNEARIVTASQGYCHAELGFQKSLEYTRERLQMRSLSGPKNPTGPADPIIVHPDVRRMLMSQKVFSEGGRMLVYYCAQLVDLTLAAATEEERKNADNLLTFLTPIAKAFITETGFESANMAIQCFGGHGFISEWGVEQNLRDCRISTLYEGTTGIQALDLLGRKVLGSGGKMLQSFTKIIHSYCLEHQDNVAMQEFIKPLVDLNKEWGEITMSVGAKAMENPDEVGGSSVDYLMYSCLLYTSPSPRD